MSMSPEVAQLVEMGFQRAEAQCALEVSGGNFEEAMEILTSQDSSEFGKTQHAQTPARSKRATSKESKATKKQPTLGSAVQSPSPSAVSDQQGRRQSKRPDGLALNIGGSTGRGAKQSERSSRNDAVNVPTAGDQRKGSATYSSRSSKSGRNDHMSTLDENIQPPLGKGENHLNGFGSRQSSHGTEENHPHYGSSYNDARYEDGSRHLGHDSRSGFRGDSFQSQRSGGYGGRASDRYEGDRSHRLSASQRSEGPGGTYSFGARPRREEHPDDRSALHSYSHGQFEGTGAIPHDRRLWVKVIRGTRLKDTGTGFMGDKSDPYVKVRVGKKEQRTETINNNLNPVWNAVFEFEVTPLDDEIVFEVWTDNFVKDQMLSTMKVYVDDLAPGEKTPYNKPLTDPETGNFSDGQLEVVLCIDGGATWTPRGVESMGLGLARHRPAHSGGGSSVVEQGMVAVPCFMNNGRESFMPPSRTFNQPTRGEYNRRLALERAPAAKLGQYDYSKDPKIVPSKPVNKHKWRDDPFYGWRIGDEQEAIQSRPPEHGGQETLALEQWQKDPFHSWMRSNPAIRPVRDKKDPFAAWLDVAPNVYNAEEQGRLARAALEDTRQQVNRLQLTDGDEEPNPLQRLPSFHTVDRKRFVDNNRDYSHKDMDQIAHRLASKSDMVHHQHHQHHHHYHHDEHHHRGEHLHRGDVPSREKRWKDDAFFGWLPGRGHGEDEMHTQAYPSSAPRSRENSLNPRNRLPSFSHSLPGMAPQMTLFLARGFNLQNAVSAGKNSGTGALRGGVFVRIQVGREQYTSKLVEAERSSSGFFGSIMGSSSQKAEVWNWGQAFKFDCEPGMHLSMELLHQSSHGIHPIGGHVMDLDKVVEHFIMRQERGEASEPFPVTTAIDLRIPESQQERWQRDLRDSEMPTLDFTLLYDEPMPRRRHGAGADIPHGEATAAARTQIRHTRETQHAQHATRTAMPSAFNSHASMHSRGSMDEGLGVLNVRVIAAYNLVNMDTGILGDVSDPYVALRLKSQGDSQRKKTPTINNDLNPVWNAGPFLFRIDSPDEELVLEVYDEDTLTGDDFIGRMQIPLIRFIQQPNDPLRIRDHMTDIQHGELEVEIVFSPGGGRLRH